MEKQRRAVYWGVSFCQSAISKKKIVRYHFTDVGKVVAGGTH